MLLLKLQSQEMVLTISDLETRPIFRVPKRQGSSSSLRFSLFIPSVVAIFPSAFTAHILWKNYWCWPLILKKVLRFWYNRVHSSGWRAGEPDVVRVAKKLVVMMVKNTRTAEKTIHIINIKIMSTCYWILVTLTHNCTITINKLKII